MIKGFLQNSRCHMLTHNIAVSNLLIRVWKKSENKHVLSSVLNNLHLEVTKIRK